jgi:hypothetical protein
VGRTVLKEACNVFFFKPIIRNDSLPEIITDKEARAEIFRTQKKNLIAKNTKGKYKYLC